MGVDNGSGGSKRRQSGFWHGAGEARAAGGRWLGGGCRSGLGISHYGGVRGCLWQRPSVAEAVCG